MSLAPAAHASAPQAQVVEDLQHTLGEGPGIDASRSGVAVLVPDLADADDPALAEWPTFARDAVDSGVLAAFAFPLLLGTARIGAMSLYRTSPGALSSEQLTHGLVTADSVALSLADKGDGLPSPDQADPMRVHQAAGMAMVQLGVPIDQALLRMRAVAFAEGATVDELVAVTGLPVATVLAALTMLERRALVVGIHGRYRPAAGLAAAEPAASRQRPRPRT